MYRQVNTVVTHFTYAEHVNICKAGVPVFKTIYWVYPGSPIQVVAMNSMMNCHRYWKIHVISLFPDTRRPCKPLNDRTEISVADSIYHYKSYQLCEYLKINDNSIYTKNVQYGDQSLGLHCHPGIVFRNRTTRYS